MSENRPALWEVHYGSDAFVACGDCVYKYLMELYHGSFILEQPELGKNYSDEEANLYASEDVFSEHSQSACEVEHTCHICEVRLDD